MTTLSAAAGKAAGRQHKRRRRIGFLDFMNRVVAQHEGREIHVILDNLKTHEPKTAAADMDREDARGRSPGALHERRKQAIRLYKKGRRSYHQRF